MSCSDIRVRPETLGVGDPMVRGTNITRAQNGDNLNASLPAENIHQRDSPEPRFRQLLR